MVKSVNFQTDSTNVYQVKRTDQPLKIAVVDNGLESGCEVPSRLSPLTLLNLTNYGIGMVVDAFSDCAHHYPKRVYLYHSGNSLKWSRWRPFKKGDVFLGIVPFTGIIDFQFFSEGNDIVSSNTSHTFGELSISRFSSQNSYLNFAVGSSRPIPVGLNGSSDYFSIRRHWLIDRIDIGTGAMGMVPFYNLTPGGRINILNFGEPRVGLSFSVGYKWARFSKLEMVYHQSFANVMALTPSFNALLSFRLTFGFSLTD